jgi:7-keto-8-aminopelargonate synthetase-like enzyme
MDFQNDDSLTRRMAALKQRVQLMRDHDFYFYNQPVEEIRGGARVLVNGRDMSMYASYSYLGLVGHPRINEAAKRAVDKFGTGTHGVRTLAGSLTMHRELEETIADFKHAEDAITYTSGYATNLTAISTLMGRGDYVLSDKLNHASIVDGCMMSGAEFRRFRHNDMDDLEKRLQQIPDGVTKWWWPTRSSRWTATSSTCRAWWPCAANTART